VRVAAVRRPQFVLAPLPLAVPLDPLDPLAPLPGVPDPLAPGRPLVRCDPADGPGVP